MKWKSVELLGVQFDEYLSFTARGYNSIAQKYQSHYTAWIETKNLFDNNCIKNYTYSIMILSYIIYCLNLYSSARK